VTLHFGAATAPNPIRTLARIVPDAVTCSARSGTIAAMKSSQIVRVLVTIGIASVVGCSGANDGSNFGGRSGSGNSNGSGSGGEGGTGGGDGLIGGGNGGNGTGPNLDPPCTSSDANADLDGDGFTPAQGDCNDCSAAMNPGAFDFPGDGVDEDCNGQKDDEPVACDTGLPAGGDAVAAAKAMGLCRMQQGASWGLVSARWAFPDGTTASQGGGFFGTTCAQGGEPPNAQSHGILGGFGPQVKPREGQSLVALSSGVARAGTNGDSPGGGEMCTQSNTPPGFPVASNSCGFIPIPPSGQANDAIALELVIKTPTNAHQLSFDFDFYTYEFPGYVCSEYNDFFVALLQTKHPMNPQWLGNVSFDSQGNPVSVNNGLVDVCDGPQNAGGKNFACSLGNKELIGTGFEGHAATSWLQTKAGVEPGETITLRFAVWDAGDEVLDSTVLIDNFGWDVDEGEAPVTVPIPH
jgi:hypothetical protein